MPINCMYFHWPQIQCLIHDSSYRQIPYSSCPHVESINSVSTKVASYYKARMMGSRNIANDLVCLGIQVMTVCSVCVHECLIVTFLVKQQRNNEYVITY